MKRLLPVLSFVLAIGLALGLSGCDRNKVPDVVGMRQQDAVRALEDAGYRLGEVSAVATDTVKLGLVAAQKPAAGERARKDSAISLAVSFSDGKRVLVPTVVGSSQTTAENTAKTLGLTPMVVEQYSAEVKSGEVAAQVPDPGAEVDRGATLVLVVSKGAAPEKAKVPDLKGKTQSDAESAIDSAGFKSVVYSSYSSDVGEGKVMGQVPDPGTSLVVGSEVQIVVSLGPGTGTVKMPSVKGKSEADAQAAIESAGLKVETLYEYSSDVAKGKVGAQFPDSGAAVAKGSEAVIVVSRGAEPADEVVVPDVSGMSQAEAESALGAAGFAVTVQHASAATDTDVVLYQFPAAQSKAAPNSDVLIVMGSQPAQ